ncbi:Levansucrase [bacterium HR11]|nr:Levansucrase [bacterium HR11]
MARFQSPPENAVQVPLTRRRVVLLFIGQLVLLGAVFLLGFWVGRGQRHLEEQLSTPVTPPVITEPGPPVTPVEEPMPSSAGAPPTGGMPSAPPPTPSASPSPAPPAGPAEVPSPKPPPSSPPTEPPSVPAGKFVLQVIALQDSAKAHALVEKLKAQGLPAYMEPSAKGLYRVRVGPYATRREAEDAITQVLKVIPESKPVVQSTP